MTTGNEVVDRIGELAFSGNVIPQTWYTTITKESGKPYLAAIVILSDIVYWYRPTEIRDEQTGQITMLKKKFKSDKLQRSYQQIADMFGISKREATNAIIFLEKLGVIKRVFRTLKTGSFVVNNVLFIELIPDVLKKLTYPKNPIVSTVGGDLSLKKVTGVTQIGDTNTKNTTKNTNFNNICGVAKGNNAPTFYKEIIDYLNNKAGKGFKATTSDTQKHINARLAEGFTIDDFKAVIDQKCAEWKGTEMKKYLRPETLFGRKFEGYLNEMPTNQSNNNGDYTDSVEGEQWQDA